MAAGLAERAAISGDPDDGGEGQRREAEGRIADELVLQPGAAGGVVLKVGPEGVDQDVDVRQVHQSRSRRSMYSASSSSSMSRRLLMPGANPPVALLTRRATGARGSRVS